MGGGGGGGERERERERERDRERESSLSEKIPNLLETRHGPWITKL